MHALTYLDAKFDGSFIDDLEANVGDERAHSEVEEESDKVPDATISGLCQLLKVDSEDQIEHVSEARSQQLFPDVEAENLPRAILTWEELLDHERHGANES